MGSSFEGPDDPADTRFAVHRSAPCGEDGALD